MPGGKFDQRAASHFLGAVERLVALERARFVAERTKLEHSFLGNRLLQTESLIGARSDYTFADYIPKSTAGRQLLE